LAAPVSNALRDSSINPFIFAQPQEMGEPPVSSILGNSPLPERKIPSMAGDFHLPFD